MKTAFDAWFDQALKYEGKVNEDVPGDRGGPTKWGITLGRLATIKGMREPKRGTPAFAALKSELFALSPDAIKDIYRRDYWLAVRADELPAGLDFACADYGLNSGPSRAVKALQKICGNSQTGTMDDETIAEATAFDRGEIITLYMNERARFLNAIVASNPTQRKFLRGWLSRAADVRRIATAMAESAPPPEQVVPAPMPKAEPAPLPAPSAQVEAAKSKTVWSLLAGLATWITSKTEAAMGWLSDRVDSISGLVSTVHDDVSGSLAPLKALAGLVKANLGAILPSLATVLIVVAIVRHVRDKKTIAELKQKVGE